MMPEPCFQASKKPAIEVTPKSWTPTLGVTSFAGFLLLDLLAIAGAKPRY